MVYLVGSRTKKRPGKEYSGSRQKVKIKTFENNAKIGDFIEVNFVGLCYTIFGGRK